MVGGPLAMLDRILDQCRVVQHGVSIDNPMITQVNQPYAVQCSTVWGGIEPVGLDLSAGNVDVSLYSTASGGERGGGDIYYMSVCSADMLTYMVVADVRGHGEDVRAISSWIYQGLQDRIDLFDGAGMLTDLNHMAHSRGHAAITTAAVLCHCKSNSTLYYWYAGHPPVLARLSAGSWSKLCLKVQPGHANLPLGAFRSVRYDEGEVPVQSGDRFLLYTDGLSEAMNPETDELFGDRDLPAILEAQGGRELANLRDALVKGATEFSGGPLLTDDCTLMVVEVR
jgi:sigma-B regulation protein RsbU (phosphoserine phosphatase)